MTPSKTYLACVLLILPLAACDPGQTPIGGFDSDGCPSDDAGNATSGDEPTNVGDSTSAGESTGAGASVALVVDCSFSWAGEVQTVRVEANDPSGITTLSFGENLRAVIAAFDDSAEARSVSITVYTEDETLSVSTLYQLVEDSRPVNEFIGPHGFTGLNMIGGVGGADTLQYACFSRDPSDPIEGWGD